MTTLLRHPDVQAASGLARKNIVSELMLENPDLDPASIEKLVDARFIDEVDRVLRSNVSAAFKSSDPAMTARADALKKVQRRFRKAADRVIPELQTARNAFAGRAELESAFEDGLSVFQRKVRPDALQKELAEKTESERSAFQQAARIALEDVLQQNNNDALGVIRALGNEWNREKLRLVVGKDAADELLGRLQIEKQFQDTNQRVLQNSRTAARLQAQDDLGVNAPSGAGPYWHAYAYGGLPGVGRQALIHSLDQLVGGQTGKQAELMREYLARALTSRGPDAQRLLGLLGEATGMPPLPSNLLPYGLLMSGTPPTSAGNSAVEFWNPRPNR